MKRLFQSGILCILCLITVMLSACGKDENLVDEGIQIVESEPLDISNDTNTAESETGTGADLFTGEYNDYDSNEPGLEIRKNADDTYQIYINIFRLASFDDAVGMLTEKGLAFSATAPDGGEAIGMIALEGDIATVKFEPGWEGFGGIYSYKYYKTSDTPNFSM